MILFDSLIVFLGIFVFVGGFSKNMSKVQKTLKLPLPYGTNLNPMEL
jgi:hypothetical protein